MGALLFLICNETSAEHVLQRYHSTTLTSGTICHHSGLGRREVPVLHQHQFHITVAYRVYTGLFGGDDSSNRLMYCT